MSTTEAPPAGMGEENVMDEVHESGVVEGAADPLAEAGEQSTSGQQNEEFVPLTALQAERKSRQQLEETVRMLQDHMTLIQSNKSQESVKKDEYDSLADDDVLTVGEAKKFIGRMQQNYNEGLSELKMAQKYSDYNEVITQYLPEVIKANPSLRDTLQHDPNKYETAYILAKNSESYRQNKRERKKSTDAERIVQNASKAGSLSSVGSTSPKSAVSNWKNMSDEEFMKRVNENMGYF